MRRCALFLVGAVCLVLAMCCAIALVRAQDVLADGRGVTVAAVSCTVPDALVLLRRARVALDEAAPPTHADFKERLAIEAARTDQRQQIAADIDRFLAACAPTPKAR